MKVDKSISVGGTVDNVDVTALSKDIVITGNDVSITHKGETYDIIGTDSTVTLGGTKTFDKKLTIAKNIATTSNGQKLVPLITTGTKSDIEFSSGSISDADPSLIMVKSSKTQSISGEFKINGNVQMDKNLQTGSLSSVSFDTLFNKYEYDSSKSTHNLKTEFKFTGALTATELVSPNVRNQDFNLFLTDVVTGKL